MTPYSPNPSLTAQLKDGDALLSSSPSGQVMEEILRELKTLKEEIQKIKTYFHIDQPVPKIIDIQRHADNKVKLFLNKTKSRR